MPPFKLMQGQGWVRWCNVIQFAENVPAKIEQGWVNRPRNKFGVTVCVVLHRSASLRRGGSLRQGVTVCVVVLVCVRDVSLRCGGNCVSGTGLRRGCLLSLPARLSQQPQFNPCVIDFTCCKEP